MHCVYVCQVNSQSLLGTRHKHAVDIVRSLRDRTLLLICDGYSDADVPQSLPAKVNQGHEPQSEGREVVTVELGRGGGPVARGRETADDGDGQVPVVQGREKVSGVSEPTVDDHWRERARLRRLARY